MGPESTSAAAMTARTRTTITASSSRSGLAAAASIGALGGADADVRPLASRAPIALGRPDRYAVLVQ